MGLLYRKPDNVFLQKVLFNICCDLLVHYVFAAAVCAIRCALTIGVIDCSTVVIESVRSASINSKQATDFKI